MSKPKAPSTSANEFLKQRAWSTIVDITSQKPTKVGTSDKSLSCNSGNAPLIGAPELYIALRAVVTHS